MHLGLIIYGSLDTLTGGFLYDKFLVEHLRGQGHTIDIVSLPWRRYPQHLSDNFSNRLKSKLSQKTYDLILQDELCHPSVFFLNHRLRQHNPVPMVSIVHQVLSRQPRKHLRNSFFKIIEKIYLSKIDAFIFNSETTRENVQGLIRLNGPFIVASPGGDRLGHLQGITQIKVRADRRGPLELVFVGNVTPIKGLSALIESLAPLPPEIWRLTVVGSLAMNPGYVRKIKQLISAKNVSRQVNLKGALDGGELIHILSEGHLFVMPFSYEGFGIACLEALAYGLPVLASTAGAVRECIHPGQDGFLIAPDQPSVLRQCIEDLHNDRGKLTRMSLAALKAYHAGPKWNHTVKSIHAFLKRLVAKRG